MRRIDFVAVTIAGLVVCPGVRPVRNTDDQKRDTDPLRALRDGADHVVVGRPIRDSTNPWAAARDMRVQIAGLYAG